MCPSDKTLAAAAGNCSRVVTSAEIGAPVVTPTTGPFVPAVTVRRSDNLGTPTNPTTDPFPAGQTIVTWTATNDLGSASCTQIINITTVGDTTPPVLTIPPDINISSSECSVLLDDELGVATATDDCTPAVTITRTGLPQIACPIPGNPTRTCDSFFFPTGTTNITYTATDAAGNTATAVQHVTITESPAIPPTITAPGDLVIDTLSTDTTCGTFVGDATLGTATATDNCPGVTVTRTGVPVGNIFPVGDTFITYTAKDRSDNTAIATQKVTVRDKTSPIVTAPGAVTLYTGAGATSCGVTVSNLDATLGTGSATDNCPGVGAVSRSGVPAGNTFQVGVTYTITYSATDAHGNSASANQTVTVVDNTPPVLSCPSNLTVYLPLHSTATSMPVNYPAATASDNCGTVNVGYSQASGSVFPIGPTTVTVTATDQYNNSSTCAFTVTVLYDFTGFFSPVNNTPTLNMVNAGRAIPVKFSLSGNKGLSIFTVNSPQSGLIACDASAPVTDLTDTVNAGGSSLSYDAGSDQYNYVWKTDSSWAGTCRQLVVTLNDGSVHVANFKFR